MTRTVTAVVENGVLRPTEPIDLPEGREVEVTIRDQRISDAEFERALDALQAEASKYPQEWWDDFDRELQENRVNFEERV